MTSKPVLKWAGGKSQLINTLSEYFPEPLINNELDTYIEPFIGGGAMFFHIMNSFKVKKAIIADVNRDLVNMYHTIKGDVNELLVELTKLSDEYLSSDNQEKYYYDVRTEFNNQSDGIVLRSAQLLFINRTCFNGLYRVNSKGDFNVPFGAHKEPTIVFESNLRDVSRTLQNVEILHGDFELCRNYIDGKTFIYYDPPYRPISKTANFNAYAGSFDDNEQIRLANMIKDLDKLGVSQMMSNSDPSNYIEDPFFDDLYEGFNINRINAKRMINANGAKRNAIKEIVVTNYGASCEYI